MNFVWVLMALLTGVGSSLIPSGQMWQQLGGSVDPVESVKVEKPESSLEFERCVHRVLGEKRDDASTDRLIRECADQHLEPGESVREIVGISSQRLANVTGRPVDL